MSIDAQAEHHEAERGTANTVTLEIPPATFDEFYVRELPRLVALLAAVTGSRPVAEDLAQEAMVRAHQRWSRISRYDLPAAWVRRVALNLASQHRARRRSERRAMEALAGQRPPAITGSADEFWALVRQLPPRQGAAVALHYLEDRPVTEVAAILGCAEGTAKAHLHKGRAGLARLLENPEPSDEP